MLRPKTLARAGRRLLTLATFVCGLTGWALAAEEPTGYSDTPQDLVSVLRCAWSGSLSPDGKLVAVGYGHWTEAGEVRLWDVAAGKPRFTFREPAGVRSVKPLPLPSCAPITAPPRASNAISRWPMACRCK